VLAVLAHEYGHVYWFDNFVQPPGSSQISNTFCNGSFYPDQIDIGGYPAVAAALRRIHLARQWASTLAAFSPDEDFVEAFELSVLAKAGLQKLTFKIDGHSDTVFPPAAGSGLATKLACFP
jgi:hypothetical protein